MSVQRLDRGELRKPKKLASGFLRADGYLTRTGVFGYRNEDGTIRRELRLPEEVFNKDSLESFAMLPVTDEHPPVFLDSSNAYAFQRGAVSETVVPEGKFVRSSLMITDSVLVTKAEKGEAVEISLGYTCDHDDTPGTTADGEQYDCIQRNIRGNHVAIVPKGRAGPEARLRMDASGATMVSPGEPPPPTNQQKRTENPLMANKTIKLDGVEYDGSEQLDQALKRELVKKDEAIAAAQAEVKTAKAALDKETARADGLKADLEKKDAELKEAPTKLRAELTAKVALETAARKVLGAKVKLDGLKTREVHELVIEKLAPKTKLDGKSDEYVEGRFDHLLENVKADADDEDEGRKALARARKATADADAVEDDEDADDEVSDEDDEEDEPSSKRGDSADAYARMITRNQKAWQSPKEKA